ncbi:MAG TPA: SMP-30/gluconolactonase/LRE family protein [Streptosporangiaceae bacterium]|jgi:sugar lactone lactonase YvrE|nr:SMP-30/gluconolactonase/LRE family protein [Streptosporangiaceae bacterium]
MRPVPVTQPAYLAESPIWDASTQSLLWADIMAGDIHRLDPASGQDSMTSVGVPVGALATRRTGGLILAAGTGFATLNERTGELRWLWTGGLGDRMNDGKCDPAGRFLGGTLTYARHPGACALYRLDPATGDVSTVLDGVTLSNGLGWSPAGDLMYYADTPSEQVDVLRYDPGTGQVSDRRMFADLHDVPGRPDGLTVDSEGCVWIAMAGGGAVRKYTPDGELDHVIGFPVSLVTSVTFGGATLADLYVTTSRENFTEADLADQPLAGSVFMVAATGVRGLPANTYAG